jgi:hypothetical protein
MPSECIPTLTRGRVLVASCLAAMAATAGCSTDRPEQVADRDCPDRPPAVYAALDVSDSGRSPALVAERLTALDHLVTDTAVCRGHVRVVAFTASAAATDVLLDRDLESGGATRRAQLRRVPNLVDGAMDEIRGRLEAAADHLPAGGTDALAQLGLADEFHRQIGADHPLQVVVWSDGIATAPVDLNRADLDTAMAGAFAAQVAVVDLAGVDVTFAGIGRPAGALPPTTFVDALKAFYQQTCDRSGAACTVVSDATAAVSR